MSAEELVTRLRGEVEEGEWSWLAPHHARGAVIVVAQELDLAEVAAAVAQRDVNRYMRLLLKNDELKELGLGKDQAGVLADITKILASHGVSIDALLQKEADEGESQTDLVALTHETKEKNMLAAIKEIQNLKTVAGDVVKIRLENLS